MTDIDTSIMQEQIFSSIMVYFTEKKVPAHLRKLIMEGVLNRFTEDAYMSLLSEFSQLKEKSSE